MQAVKVLGYEAAKFGCVVRLERYRITLPASLELRANARICCAPFAGTARSLRGFGGFLDL